MKASADKIAVVFYGHPGSGKGTQAELLAKKIGLIHFDTGRYIERLVHGPASRRDPVISKERRLFDSGVLNTPAWVLAMVKRRVAEIAASGSGVVFSGSPRTLYEAFGDGKTSGLISLLEKKYGRKNLFIFSINTSEKSAVNRNTGCLICSVCGLQLLSVKSLACCINKTHCPFCGGPLIKRVFDNPEKMKIRLEQYRQRTRPIEKRLKELGFKITKINGEPAPYRVAAAIFRKIHPVNAASR
ncbi:MAG: nucleoside monophosphate kinase [Parcubacteria group bacterium]|nr:nucleoside monophosphate kinase [Parcubacteria group bacterium]